MKIFLLNVCIIAIFQISNEIRLIKSCLLVLLIFFSTLSYAQNTFPANGNVGIGTAPLSEGNAASWLTINGTSNYSGGLIYAIGGLAKGFSYIDGDGSLTQQAMGAGQKFIVNSTTTAMSIAANGNVGIGTAPLSGGNAASWLAINGNSYSGGIIYTAGGLAKGFSYVDSDGLLTQQAMGTGQRFIVNGSTTALSMSASGNVGIGTTAPFARFHVRDDLNSGTIAVGSDNYPALLYSSAATGEFRIDNRSSSIGYITFFPNGQGTTAGSEAMRISKTGDVGIGTTDSKGYKLAVAGNMIAEQVTVKLQASWPDYVFRDNYTLAPLSEVKTYIDQNHHLPDVPSEQQVQKDGLNLGEMNAKLLKKIEDLTLYMIEKDRELKIQQADSKSDRERISKLEQQVELLIKNINSGN